MKAFGVFLLVVATFVFYRWYFGPQITLGAETVEVLQKPDRVDVYKIVALDYGLDKSQKGNSQNSIGGHPITGVGNPLDAKVNARQLGKILTGRNAYFPFGGSDVFSSCGFSPGLAFRFTKGSLTVNVLACYQCQHIAFFTKDEHQNISSHLIFFYVEDLKPFFRQGFPQDKRLFDREIDAGK